MTDRISIPALRESVQVHVDHDDPGVWWMPPATALALVEAVEAAQDVLLDTQAIRRGTVGPYADLAAALARFDFGEET